MTINPKKLETLKKITSSDNPLSSVINFSPDGNSFMNFEKPSKCKKIIGEDGRFMFEEIAREVLMQTFLKDEQKNYSTENHHGDHRSDLIAKIDKDISSVIEVKETDAISTIQLTKLVDDSFSQIKNFYVSEFKKDCFVSVVVMNLALIAENTDLLTKYFNLDVFDRKDKKTVFSKYGIYIETRRYDHLNAIFSVDSWPNLSRHGEFSIKNSDFSVGGLKKIYCEIQNAIKLPSSSTNSYGIKNVRNIKDPNISTEKRDLILSIINTSWEAFEQKNSSIITNAGKDKDFLVSEDETLFYEQPYKDFTHLTVCTLNGAIIDGQNSIDSFRWIIDTLEKVLRKEPLIGFENHIQTLFKIRENELEKFLNFLKKTDVSVNIEQTPDAESAIKRAISKNNTMQVTKSELAISGIQIPIQILANEILEKNDINIDFPKKEVFIPSKNLVENKIDIEELVRYLSCINDFTNPKIKNSTALFKFAGSLRSKNKPDFTVLNEFVQKTNEETADSKELQHEIKTYESKCDTLRSVLKSLKDLPVQTPDIKVIIDDNESQLENYEEEIERLTEKSKMLNDIAYKVRDRVRLVSILKRIFVIKKQVRYLYEKMSQTDPDKIQVVKEYISNQAIFMDYIFVMSLKKHPVAIDYEVLVRDVTALFDQLVANLENIHKNYKVEMTTIRNASDDSVLCLKTDGVTSCPIGDVRNEFFKV